MGSEDYLRQRELNPPFIALIVCNKPKEKAPIWLFPCRPLLPNLWHSKDIILKIIPSVSAFFPYYIVKPGWHLIAFSFIACLALFAASTTTTKFCLQPPFCVYFNSIFAFFSGILSAFPTCVRFLCKMIYVGRDTEMYPHG